MRFSSPFGTLTHGPELRTSTLACPDAEQFIDSVLNSISQADLDNSCCVTWASDGQQDDAGPHAEAVPYRHKFVKVVAVRVRMEEWLQTFVSGMHPDDTALHTRHNDPIATNLRCATTGYQEGREEKALMLMSQINTAIWMIKDHEKGIAEVIAVFHPSTELLDEVNRLLEPVRSIHMGWIGDMTKKD